MQFNLKKTQLQRFRESRRTFFNLLAIVKPELSIAFFRTFLAACKLASSICPQLVQINFSPLRLSLSTCRHLLQVRLVCRGSTLYSFLPDFAATYSSFWVNAYQLASAMERFKPRFAA